MKTCLGILTVGLGEIDWLVHKIWFCIMCLLSLLLQFPQKVPLTSFFSYLDKCLNLGTFIIDYPVKVKFSCNFRTSTWLPFLLFVMRFWISNTGNIGKWKKLNQTSFSHQNGTSFIGWKTGKNMKEWKGRLLFCPQNFEYLLLHFAAQCPSKTLDSKFP